MQNNIFLKHHEIGLKIIGAWPGTTSLSGFFAIVAWSIFLLIFAFWNIAIVYRDLEMLMDNLVSTIGTVLGLLKLSTLKIKRGSLTSMINKMFEDWSKASSLKVMTNNFTRSKLVSKSIIVLYNAVYLMYVLKTVMSYILDSVDERKYLAAVTFPIDGRQSPLYEMICVGQFVLAFSCFNIHALIEGLLAFSVLHATSKVDIVRLEIKKFSRICRVTNNNKVTLLALKKLSQKHVNFIEFSENVQDIFSYISFFHIFFLTLIQVLSGYMFLDALERGEKSINLVHYSMLTVMFLVSSGYYCIAGEYLTNQSELIFKELYNCIWYEFRIPQQKAINFMLVKARKSVNLTLGKFDDLSLVHLTKIIKTSFSYLSLVRAVR